jgi:sodium transport system ATP-binding protein
MIELKQISKRFGGTLAVDALTLTARDACITGLLGANGAGKSTTLRMIAGVLHSDGGTICIGSRDLCADRTAAHGDLGALLDHTGLYERLTPRENLHYFARLRGVSHSTAERPIERLLDELELTRVAGRAVSQGERMKVALGSILVHEPKHLLLGEVQALCDQIAVIADGVVVGQGTAQSLCEAVGADSLENAFISLTKTSENAAC